MVGKEVPWLNVFFKDPSTVFFGHPSFRKITALDAFSGNGWIRYSN
jgi:hypothetical protein